VIHAANELVVARDCIVPDWAAPSRVRALVTTRGGGVSTGARATLDLGGHDSTDAAVLENRRRLRAILPGEPHWLHQVHGNRVITLDASARADAWPQADAAVTSAINTVCAVRIADCMPVLLADAQAKCVGIAHAGWRGLARGVIGATIATMRSLGSTRQLAWLGPAIGAKAFEVGAEVRDAFCATNAAADAFFAPGAPGKWHADLYGLARLDLRAHGVHEIAGGGYCTRDDAARFFSYRRDRDTGRMAALIWLAPPLS